MFGNFKSNFPKYKYCGSFFHSIASDLSVFYIVLNATVEIEILNILPWWAFDLNFLGTPDYLIKRNINDIDARNTSLYGLSTLLKMLLIRYAVFFMLRTLIVGHVHENHIIFKKRCFLTNDVRKEWQMFLISLLLVSFIYDRTFYFNGILYVLYNS